MDDGSGEWFEGFVDSYHGRPDNSLRIANLRTLVEVDSRYGASLQLRENTEQYIPVYACTLAQVVAGVAPKWT